MKLWPKLLIFLVCSMLVGTFVVMGDRTISDSSDDVYTKILDSNGTYYTMTDANLQSAITNAGSGGWVKVPSGTIAVDQNISITVDDFEFRGLGNGTLFDFSAGRILINASNVYVGNFAVTGDVYRGAVYIRSENYDIGNITVENVYAEHINTSLWTSSYECVFGGCADSCTISNVHFINCHVFESSHFAFGTHSKTGKRGWFKNVFWDGCTARKIGRPYLGDGDWTVGFCINHNNNIDGAFLSNCLADECYESGFHQEDAPISRNVVLTNCVSKNNGINKAGASYGAGYILTENVTMTGCMAIGNEKHGIKLNGYGNNTVVVGGEIDGQGVTDYGVTIDYANNSKFSNLVIKDTTSFGFNCYNGINNMIMGCSIYGVGNDGINIRTTTSNDGYIIVGNTILYNGDFGVYADGSHHIIANNIVGNNANTGVYVKGDNCSISNNVVYDNSGSYGIHLAAAKNCSVVGNVVNGHTDGIFLAATSENCLVDSNLCKGYTAEGIDDDSAGSTVGDNET